jgi:acyl-lipid omega-6 desaturase (Delta-12 desaturase)
MSDLYSSTEANNLILKYRANNNIRGIYEILTTLTIYFATLIGSYWAYQHNSFICIIPLIFFNALSMVRIYVLEHDCSHGSLFAFKVLNIWFGRLASLITLTPLYAWRWRHLVHHKIVNSIENRTISQRDRRDTGYVILDTVSEYQKKSKVNKLLYKLMCNPFLYYIVLAPFYFIVMLRFTGKMEDHPEEYKKKHRHSTLLTNLCCLLYYALFLHFFGITFFMNVYLISLIFATAFGTWLFQVQHIFPETKFFSSQDEGFLDFTFQTTSFYKLPRLLDWFTCSIGYHHIHHVFPIIPGYNLKKCYDENPMLHAVHTVTIWDTLKIMRLRLYDDVKSHRLIPWKEYYQQFSE